MNYTNLNSLSESTSWIEIKTVQLLIRQMFIFGILRVLPMNMFGEWINAYEQNFLARNVSFRSSRKRKNIAIMSLLSILFWHLYFPFVNPKKFSHKKNMTKNEIEQKDFIYKFLRSHNSFNLRRVIGPGKLDKSGISNSFDLSSHFIFPRSFHEIHSFCFLFLPRPPIFRPSFES